jgi:AcrR family transcriptional regulator
MCYPPALLPRSLKMAGFGFRGYHNRKPGSFGAVMLIGLAEPPHRQGSTMMTEPQIRATASAPGNRAPTKKGAAARRIQTGQALSQARVLEAAIRIGDEESLDALTMRRLARDLGVGTMTLYSYFRNKNELLDGMADEILGSLELPPMEGFDPAEALAVIAHRLRDMMRAHPSVVRLFGTRTTRSQRAMRGSYEQVLQALVDIGLAPSQAVRAYGLLLVYALGFSGYELPRPWGRNPEELEGVEELRRQRGLFYEALPKDEFPVMVPLSDTLVTLPSDEQFEWGLNVLIRGMLGEHGPECRDQ